MAYLISNKLPKIIGIGYPYVSAAASLGTTIATTHYNRVIADGGVLPVGISGLGSVLDSVITAYGVTDSADFNTKVPVFLDPSYTGYKLGAGSGTTLGQAARTVYAISSSADVTQTTAASQPLLLAHSGDNYWWGSGVSGNAVTSNSVNVNVTTDCEFIAAISDYDKTALIYVHGIQDSANFSLFLDSNKIRFLYGVTDTTSSTIPTNSTWIRASKSGSTLTFYTSTNPLNTAFASVSWTQLGSPVTITTSATFSNISLYVGRMNSGGAYSFTGKIYRATISNSIGGTPVVDFNPAQYNAATSQTDWISATGEVWTINAGTAATGYKGVLVDRTILQGDGVDDGLRVTGLASRQYYSQYIGVNPMYSAGNVGVITGGTNTHLLFATNSTTLISYNASSLGFVGEIANKLILATINFEASAAASNLYNNANKQTGTIGANTSTELNVLGSSGNGYSNANITTLLLSVAIDTPTQNTAMYNIIRSMNNNAF